jgi:hypothetical protein
MIWWDEKDFAQGNWRYALPVVMLFLSWMMVSEVKYPTFKKLDLKATRTFTRTLVGVLLIGAALILREKLLYWAFPLFFTAYLLYGLHPPPPLAADARGNRGRRGRRRIRVLKHVRRPSHHAGDHYRVHQRPVDFDPGRSINLTIINEGARRGFRWAALIGCGATAMEVLYCAIAFTSFAAFFQKGWIKSAMGSIQLCLHALPVRAFPHGAIRAGGRALRASDRGRYRAQAAPVLPPS